MDQAQPKAELASDTDDVSRETDRLEAALDRIAALAAAASARTATPGSEISGTDGPDSGASHIIIDTAAVTSRLDSLIARLKAAVGEA